MSQNKELYFLPLGGAGEIGMNLNLYSYQGEWLMVDLGITFVDKLGAEIAMPDPHFIEQKVKNLKGLVLTHAHEDHIGAVPYLWSRLGCPVYATPFTAEVVRRKLQDVGLANSVPLHVVKPRSRLQVGSFEIEYVDLTHSIPEPSALAIRTPAGTILHSGDWKIDKNPLVGSHIDTKRLEEIGNEGVLALVCDSTNVFVEGESKSELDVRESLTEIVAAQKGKVIMSCFASNVARLQTAAVVAQKTGRKLALMGRSMHRMFEIARQCGYLEAMDNLVNLNQISKLSPSQVMVVCTGSQGESRAALSKIIERRSPEIRLDTGDTVIFSSRVIPGNEAEIHALERKLKAQGVIVYTSENAFTHVSGHPSRQDLRQMYSWIRPKILVPVHGEHQHMDAQAALGKEVGIPHCIAAANGTMIKLHDKGADFVETVRSGRLILDGGTLVAEQSHHFRDREKLSESGVLALTVVVGGAGQLLSDPQLTLVGVVPQTEEKELTKRVHAEIQDVIKSMSKSEKEDSLYIRDKIQHEIGKYVNKILKKTPALSVHVVRLKAKGN